MLLAGDTVDESQDDLLQEVYVTTSARRVVTRARVASSSFPLLCVDQGRH